MSDLVSQDNKDDLLCAGDQRHGDDDGGELNLRLLILNGRTSVIALPTNHPPELKRIGIKIDGSLFFANFFPTFPPFDDDDVDGAAVDGGGGGVRQDNEDDNLFCDDLDDAELVSVAPDVKRPKM